MAAKPPVTATATEPDVPTDQTTFNASMISALQAIAANQPRRRKGMHGTCTRTATRSTRWSSRTRRSG
jgi:hypothetical protein